MLLQGGAKRCDFVTPRHRTNRTKRQNPKELVVLQWPFGTFDELYKYGVFGLCDLVYYFQVYT